MAKGDYRTYRQVDIDAEQGGRDLDGLRAEYLTTAKGGDGHSGTGLDGRVMGSWESDRCQLALRVG